MGRRKLQEVSIIKDLIIRIITENNIDSPSVIVRKLKEEYGKNVSRNFVSDTVNEYKKSQTGYGILTENIYNAEGSEVSCVAILEMEYENHPEIIKINNRIKTLQNDFDKTVSVTERCRISGQIDSAQETKLKLKKILKETEMMAEKSNKIQYVVYFDGPDVALKDDEKNEKKETKEK